MKRFLMSVFLMVLFRAVSIAATPVYNGNLVNGVIVSTTNLVIDVSAISGDYVAFQANFSTPTYAPSTFIDGVKSTGTVIISSDTGKLALTVMGQTYTEGTDFTQVIGYSSMTALNLYNALVQTGTKASGYLTLYSTYSLTNSSFTFYGKQYVAGTDWQIGYSSWSATVARNLTLSSIWADLAPIYNGIYLCTLNTSSITFTACNYGTAYNSTISVYVTTMTASGISGGTLPPLSGISFSSASVNGSSLIRATATVVGVGGNYTFTSSSPTAMIVTGMAGGVNSQVTYAPFYTVYSTQTYPAGLSVLFTNTGGTSPTNLTANTTYYVIPFNSTSYRLATTRDNAIAGVSIAIANSTLDRGTFAITPTVASTSTISTFGLVWQGSNDGLNWWNLSVASATIFSTSTWTTQNWDIGKYDYEYIRAYVTPTINTLNSIFLQVIGYITKIAQ